MTARTTAARDENDVPSLLAVSKDDGVTPVVLWADPGTHALLVDDIGGGGGGSGYQQPTSGVVNGINAIFTWTTSPNIIVVDETRSMQRVSSDGTVNWTGTTTTVLSIAPNFDIYASA